MPRGQGRYPFVPHAAPPTPTRMRVLGIDTSLRSTGFGVVESAGSRLRAVEYGSIRIPASLPRSVCLVRIHDDLRAVIARAQPEAVAIEGIFFCKNVRTAVVLGEARGAAISACAAAGVPVFEYPPRRVKQAVVGYGAAAKQQVGLMIRSMLGLTESPQEDAADAMALAICHLQAQSRLTELQPEPI